jgi:hypothetical protein
MRGGRALGGTGEAARPCKRQWTFLPPKAIGTRTPIVSSGIFLEDKLARLDEHGPGRMDEQRMSGTTSKMLLRATLIASAVLIAHGAHARSLKENAQGTAIGSGIAVLVDGGGGVFSGATAGLLVNSISRRGQR